MGSFSVGFSILICSMTLLTQIKYRVLERGTSPELAVPRYIE